MKSGRYTDIYAIFHVVFLVLYQGSFNRGKNDFLHFKMAESIVFM